MKHTFSNLENAAVALRSALPAALSQRIDWQSLRLESGSHVDHLLSDTHTDLLFSTSIAGRSALLYVLFEHQSTPDALMPLRLLKYIVRVLDWHVENAKALGQPKLPLPLAPGTFYDQVQIHAPEATETLMTIAEQLQAKGRAEGEAKGRAVAVLAVASSVENLRSHPALVASRIESQRYLRLLNVATLPRRGESVIA